MNRAERRFGVACGLVFACGGVALWQATAERAGLSMFGLGARAAGYLLFT